MNFIIGLLWKDRMFFHTDIIKSPFQNASGRPAATVNCKLEARRKSRIVYAYYSTLDEAESDRRNKAGSSV